MRRFWIFLLVGPLVGFVCALFAGAGELLATPYVLLVLVIFYVAGAIPALLACLVDHRLSDIGQFRRAAATSLAGYIFVVAMLAIYFGRIDWGIAAVGIAGAVAGLICSLMSSEKQKEEARRMG
jgi:hypothetical protein